jgi:hypothetical protein
MTAAQIFFLFVLPLLITAAGWIILLLYNRQHPGSHPK